MPWEVIQLIDKTNVDLVRQKITKYFYQDKLATPYQDLDWLLDGKEFNTDFFVYSYDDENDNHGIAILRKQIRPLEISFGEFILYKHNLLRSELWAGPTILTNNENSHQSIMTAFLIKINDNLNANEALSIEGVRVDSYLNNAKVHAASNLKKLQLGGSYLHQSIEFPESNELYLKQMSKRSRKSVQYSHRKLKKEFDVNLFKCEKKDDISKFLDSAITISKTTYQWNLLGLGLRDRDGLEKTLLKWLKNNGLHSYILYCNDTPVAFMLGFVYRSCYHYIDVGFNPEWANYSVGSVLQLEVIEDLYSLATPPKSFDFSTGFGEHKARFGNTEQEEVNLLFLPDLFKNKVLIFAYKNIAFTSDKIVHLLDVLGIKKRLKKLIRRLS